jgi:2-phospho-L-lactate guanylyltransferase
MKRGAAFALIPMKRFSAAKSRLRDQLSDDARSVLARGMFERVLAAARACSSLTGSAVLTNGDEVAALAERTGAHVLRDARLETPTLGALLDAALVQLLELGAERALVLMGDLPYLEASDVERMLAALDTCDVAIAPDARGHSTNALAVRLPLGFATAFGDPDSYAVHRTRAKQRGLRLLELRLPRVAHDVDIGADLPTDGAWLQVPRVQDR